MDMESLIVLLVLGVIKIILYSHWRISKRMGQLENDNAALKKIVRALHKEEFDEFRNSLHRINSKMAALDENPLREAEKDLEEVIIRLGCD